MKGSIKEKEIDFLLDTGAEITVIPTKLAQGLNIPYKKTKLCLTGVKGEDSVLYETPPIEVIDMSNGLFSVPLHSDSQPWLAFTVDYEQYQWTRLPQGFQNSPTIYHQSVRRDLCDPECPVKQSTMIQYVDDILIASTDHEVHQTELASLLDYLHKKKTQMQLSQSSNR